MEEIYTATRLSRIRKNNLPYQPLAPANKQQEWKKKSENNNKTPQTIIIIGRKPIKKATEKEKSIISANDTDGVLFYIYINDNERAVLKRWPDLTVSFVPSGRVVRRKVLNLIYLKTFLFRVDEQWSKRIIRVATQSS
jgi:hypothetical protein